MYLGIHIESKLPFINHEYYNLYFDYYHNYFLQVKSSTIKMRKLQNPEKNKNTAVVVWKQKKTVSSFVCSKIFESSYLLNCFNSEYYILIECVKVI